MAIGKSVPMLDSVARVTGSVPYAANLKLPDMLVGKVFRSPVPHARITKLDVSEAEKVPGVVAILTGADFKGPDAPNLHFGSSVLDQPIIAHERIRYTGEPIALIAAETSTAAEKAISLIELDYEELPSVFDAEEALASDAPKSHSSSPDNVLVHSKLRRGNVENGFSEADEVIEETYYSPVAQQSYLEPQVAVAQWEDGKLTVWTSSQSPYTVRKVLAKVFKIEPEEVRVIVPPVGGGFGGKGNVRTQPLAAALAWKVGERPVKLVMSREEEFFTVTKHAAKIKIKSGVKRDGSITARKITIYWNVGAYSSSSIHLVPAGMLRAIGPYVIPNVHVDAIGIYTNLPPAAAYRGAMSSQGVFAHESHMSSISNLLGLDPLEYRIQNLLKSGDSFATGETLHDIHFIECLQSAAQGLGWEKAKRKSSARIKYGRGLGVMMKNTIANSTSQCRIQLKASGELVLFTSSVEMGQGSHTALAQIAAEASGIELANIRVVGPDTDITPPDAQTASSRTTYMMGNAVIDSVNKLEDQVRAMAAEIYQIPETDISSGAGILTINNKADEKIRFVDILNSGKIEMIEALGTFSTNVGRLDPETGQGVSTPDWHQGAGACEVAVDIETGKVEILRFHAASFAGKIINPRLAKLQDDGNVIYGLGASLYEEMIFDEGQLTNANLSDYMIPSFLDTPKELISNTLESEGSNFHGIGEMTLPPVAPAIANAIFDAVGVRIYDLPLSAEKVLRAIKDKEKSDG